MLDYLLFAEDSVMQPSNSGERRVYEGCCGIVHERLTLKSWGTKTHDS